MKITENCVVSFDYTLTDDAGEVIDSSSGGEPLAYLHGHKHIVQGLEKAMQNREVGDAFEISVPPDEGYGEHHERLIQQVPRSVFGDNQDLQVGMRFQANSDAGPMMVVVTAVGDETVTVDGNHALAGQTLHFAIEVKEVREATAQELEHRHVHVGGHDH